MFRIHFKNRLLIFLLIVLCSIFKAQSQIDGFNKGSSYIVDSITVSGLKTFNDKTVISYSGIRKGQLLQIPGEEITSAINKLWKLELFSDINFYVTNIDGNKATIEIEIKELPTLSAVKIKGVKKSKSESLIKDTELSEGKKLSESFLTNTRNYIINKYKISKSV